MASVISVHVRKGDSCVAEGREEIRPCANFGVRQRDSTPTKLLG